MSSSMCSWAVAFMNELLAMVLGLRDGRVEVVCAMEDTVRTIREPAAVRVQMGERCHDDGGPGSTDSAFRQRERNVAGLVAKPGIREPLQFEDCFKVVRIGYPLEEPNRREPVGDKSPARLPLGQEAIRHSSGMTR